jgi:hypothetical protein
LRFRHRLFRLAALPTFHCIARWIRSMFGSGAGFACRFSNQARTKTLIGFCLMLIRHDGIFFIAVARQFVNAGSRTKEIQVLTMPILHWLSCLIWRSLTNQSMKHPIYRRIGTVALVSNAQAKATRLMPQSMRHYYFQTLAGKTVPQHSPKPMRAAPGFSHQPRSTIASSSWR